MSEKIACIGLDITQHPSFYGPDAVGTILDGVPTFGFWEMVGFGSQQVYPINERTEHACPFSSLDPSAYDSRLITLYGQRGLVGTGDLTKEDLNGYNPPEGAAARADFVWATANKIPLLNQAADRFIANHYGRDTKRDRKFRSYIAGQNSWLDANAVYMASAERHGTIDWRQWGPGFREGITSEADILRDTNTYLRTCYLQWIAHQQHKAWANYVHSLGGKLTTILPYSPNLVSVPVWASQHEWGLNNGEPEFVSGAPDSFDDSGKGQVWGHPLRRPDEMAKNDFASYVGQVARQLDLFDHAILDHIAGVAGEPWAVRPNGEDGHRVPGMGRAVFEAMRKAGIDTTRLIGEDVGEVSDDIRKTMKEYGIPGMRMWQVAPYDTAGMRDPKAPGGAENSPLNAPADCFYFTGTHDFPTQRQHVEKLMQEQGKKPRILGSYRDAVYREQLKEGYLESGMPPEEASYRAECEAWQYVDPQDPDMRWATTRTALAAAAKTVVLPYVDVLWTNRRQNLPGHVVDSEGQPYWSDRLDHTFGGLRNMDSVQRGLTDDGHRLRALIVASGRCS